MKLEQYIKKFHKTKSNTEIAMVFKTTRDRVHRLRTKLGLKSVRLESMPRTLDVDIKNIHEHKSKVTLQSKYKEAIGRLEIAETERDAVLKLVKGSQLHKITPSVSKGTGEAVAVIVGSDWHIEEEVRAEAVNGRNSFNLSIAKFRVDDFFSHALKLLKKEQAAQNINHVVLALLGDFISGNIHEELLESCKLRPIEAIMLVRNWIVSGIMFLLENSNCTFDVVCCVGNHTRITKKVHIANERGNNLEYFMYHVLADYFKDEKRIKFVIDDGYHTYLDVYGMTIRFHHGHALKYNGGVGGLTVPVNKAIAQWNKTRTADLDVFGHWHTQFDGGNFLCNGSLIGYNAFALFIKASYEPPRQLFFLIDKKRGKTVVAPIVFGK